MRILYTLLLLCVCSAQARSEWRSEMYLLGGVGKVAKNETGLFSGNVGMTASAGGDVFYFNASAGLYLLRSEGYISTWFYQARSTNYTAEVAVGGGVMGQLGVATLRFGPDVGVNIGVSSRGTSYSIIPKAMLTFDLGNMDLGIMAKANFPMVSQKYYAPAFYGGGLILCF